MAQAGYTPIRLYYSTTASAVPTAANLAAGELALNIADMKLYCENSSGVVTLLASASGSSGDVVGPASSTDNAVVRFDGTTGKLVQNSGVLIADDGTTVISVNSATDALRITQTGAGNALVVEDSTNPDATPFVVNADGRVVVGNTSAISSTSGIIPFVQLQGATEGQSSFFASRFSADNANPQLVLAKSRNATVGSQTIVQADDNIGSINYLGSDGTNFISAARIQTQVDGTPGTNDMPGRLVFSTTADGASTPTERMRITNAGNVGIATTSPGSALDVKGTLRLSGSSSGYVGLAPAAAAGSTTYTLPSADGTSGQVLSTNGSGTLSWASGGGTPLSSATTTTVAAAATTTINCALGSVFNITWGATITTLSFTNVPASPQATQLVLVFKKDTSANQYSIVWPTSIAWQDNTPPSTNVNPNSVITVTLTTINGGTNWRGSFQTIEGYAGALWGWGGNANYQLGDGTSTSKSSPVQIGSLSTWVSIGSFQEAGGSYAITNDGVINGAGTEGARQFGLDGSSVLGPFIYMVPVASGLRATAISGATTTQLAIDLEGKLWGWGAGASLGLGITGQRISTPAIVNSGTWIDISTSNENSFAIRSDGTIWATGRGSEGALGQGNTTGLSYWVQVGSGTTWSSIATSTDTQAHVIALKTDGTMWAWGYNAQGQLGLGNVTNRSSPVQIGALTTWVQISASYLSSAAIKSDGTLWTWGYNVSGQLGQGDTTDRSSPTQVGALTNWRQVCVARLNMYAIKTDGTLWAWGYGSDGNIGNNSTVDRSSPVQVGAATDWLWLPKRASGLFIHCIRGTATNP